MPPPPSAVDVFETRIHLDTGVVLMQRQTIYRGRIYDFCLKLIVELDGADHEVERVDSCHLEIHRHLFARDGREADRISICAFDGDDHRLVTQEHDRAYDNYVDTWESRVRRWEGT